MDQVRRKVKRQLPRWSQLRELAKPRPFIVNPTDRRLARAGTISDLRMLARRRTPRSVFDYTDGAAETETSLRRARHAFSAVEFTPSALRDVSTVDMSTDLLGKPSALPLILAPTGFTRMMNHEGERAVAAVAERAGIPYTLSTMGTTSIEEVAQSAPQGRHWFQLYLWKDREASMGLIERAAKAGYDTLMLTVDTPVAGARMRDVKNGLTIPPSLTLKTVADMSLHPAWWANVLSTEPLVFASLTSSGGTVADMIDRMFDPSVTIADLGWLREAWPGNLVIKGIQNVDDARAVVDAGAQAVVLSNHGGRQLDRAPTPIELVGKVSAAIGDHAQVYVDTGILSGADVVAAVAQGADAAMVGRAYLYGLMAGGERGVQRAVDILTAEIYRTMRLLGVKNTAELTPAHARLRSVRD